MCGIVAAFGDISIKVEQAFKQMLIMDSVRGLDSTGVAVIDRNGDVSVIKEVGNPFYLLDSDLFDKAMRGSHKGLIGHNRAATTGKILRKNAHPFEFSDVVGVHNGTLSNKWELPGHIAFDTDSEALYNHLNEHGAEETINKCLGAWSLVWYDKVNDEANFLRNAERPMCFAFSKDKKTLFLASEMWMIIAACARNGIEMEEVYSTEIDVQYSYEIPASFQPFKEPTKFRLEGKKKPVTTVTTTQTSSATGNTGTTNTPALSSRAGETLLGYNAPYRLKGVQLFERTPTDPKGKKVWYVLLEHVFSYIKSAPMYVYLDSKKEAQKFLEGEWEMRVSRAVANGGTVIRYVIDSSPTSYKLVKKDNMTDESISHIKCCNCNSKVELSEDWVNTPQGILCGQCAEDETVLSLISQMTGKGF